MAVRSVAVAVAATVALGGCRSPSTSHAIEDHVARPTLPSEAARAFIITRAADLLAGVEADGRIGDVRLDNGRCAFIIDRVESALGFADSGGEVIDAAPLPSGRDAIKQVFGYLKDEFPRQPIHDRVEVENPGPATASVIASGHDSGNAKLHLTTRYTLRPGSCALEITTTVTNTGVAAESGYSVGDAVQWGQAERFAPGFGDAVHGRRPLLPGYLLGYSDGASYAYVIKKGPLDARHGGAWSDLNAGKVELAAGSSGSVTRWLVVGPPDGSALLDEVRRLTSADWGVVSGTVIDSRTGAPLAGARVIVESGGHPIQMVRSRPGPGPNFTLPAPPGPYLLRAEGLGRGTVEQSIDLGAPASRPVMLAMAPSGSLHFVVVDGDGQPSPAKLTLIGLAETRTPYLGTLFTAPGGNVAMTATGDGVVTVPPGRYRAVASRGPFFELDTHDLEVPAGGEARASFTLRRAVDLGAYRCADLHQHAQPSPDSGVALADRALTNLAEGLDVFVPTDHNMIADWGPTLAALPLPLPLVVGTESTLDLVGHWNAYPLTLHAGQPRGGALDVRGLDAHGIVAGLRAAVGGADRVVQVNHPRAGIIGYFNMAKLDPASPSLPPNWEGSWDAIEVFSGKDVKHLGAPLADWRSLLDRGLLYTAVGGSDSHLVAGQEVGYPRTCVQLQPGNDQIATQLVDAIKRRRDALVTNGPVISVRLDGKGMGATVNAQGRKTLRLELDVQAAPWVDVRRVEILRASGRALPPISLPASTARVRLHRAIDLPVDGDDYVIVIARGEATMAPALSQQPGGPPPLPLALTNPIYVDAEGDGVWRSHGNSTSHPATR